MNISIKEISDKFKKFFDLYAIDYEEPIYEEEKLKTWFDKVNIENSPYFVLEEIDIAFLQSGEENLIKLIDLYFKSASEVFNYFENKYPRYGGKIDYLCNFDPIWLYLCAIYHEHINNEKYANYSYYLCVATISNIVSSNLQSGHIEINQDLIKMLELLEEKFKIIKEMIYPDWIAINPKITFCIGKYYFTKGEFEKAFEYFKLGSSINYNGRQSIEPFKLVAKNTYGLAILYLKGLGVEKDETYAIKLFKKVSSKYGEEYFPKLGNIKYEDFSLENLHLKIFDFKLNDD